MQYGFFDDAKKEYVISSPNTPRSWTNYLGSTEYGAIITNNETEEEWPKPLLLTLDENIQKYAWESDSFYSWGGLLGLIPLIEEGYLLK